MSGKKIKISGRNIIYTAIKFLVILTLVTCNGNGTDEINYGFSNDDLTASIISPDEEGIFSEKDKIIFACIAADSEEGELDGDSLIWTSSIDNQIGTGTDFSIHDLSPGIHTITLTATNNTDEIVSDSIIVTVNAINKIEIIDSDINYDTNWNADKIYMIEKSIKVNAILTIEPGAIIKLTRKKFIAGEGEIIARGTEDNPIIFTSYRDDGFGGDSNGDGNRTSPGCGDWSHIKISGNNNSSVFNYCEFYNSGVTELGEQTLLLDAQTNATVTNCTFVNNSGDDSGVLHINDAGDKTIIEGNIFYNNEKPLCIRGDIRFNMNDSNIFHNPDNPSETNSKNGIFIKDNPSIAGNVLWSETEIPFVILEDLDISNNSLGLADNVIIKFNKSKLNYNGNNLLNFDGPGVYFTSYKDDNHKGDTNGNGNLTIPSDDDWFGIYNPNSPPNYYEEWSNIQHGMTNGYRKSIKIYLTNDFIDEDGFRYFALNPQSKYPVIIKTLEVNVTKGEEGFYIDGTIYIRTLDTDQIVINNCKLNVEYGEGGLIHGLRRLYGSANFPMPEPGMPPLSLAPEAVNDMILWLETARYAQVEIGMDFGKNLNDMKLPLNPDISYLFFRLTVPLYFSNDSVKEISLVYNPLDPAFFFAGSFEGDSPLWLKSLDFATGISLNAQIPFIFDAWDEVGKDKPEYFEQFGETSGSIDLSFDWFGQDFEGFHGFDENPGFYAHLYFKGNIGLEIPFLPYAQNNLTLNGLGEMFINVDPDKDGLCVNNSEDIDYTLGIAGQMQVDVPLFNIGELVLDTEANAIVNITNQEKALYFHGRLDQSLNVQLGDKLPVSFNQNASIEASGLIDHANPGRNFLRLKGEFGLNFDTPGLEGLGVPMSAISGLETTLLTSAELRINKDGMWIRGEVKSTAQLSAITLKAGALIELYIDSNLSIPNNSYFKIYGEAGAAFDVEFASLDYMRTSLPDSSTNQTLNISSAVDVSAAMKISWDGIYLGGKLISSSQISVIKFGGGASIDTFIDFRPGIGESAYFITENALSFIVTGIPLFLSASSRLEITTSSIALSGKLGTPLREIEVSAQFSGNNFMLTGHDSFKTPCVIIYFKGDLELSISNTGFSYDLDGSACECITDSCLTMNLLGGEVDIFSDNPKITVSAFGASITLFKL